MVKYLLKPFEIAQDFQNFAKVANSGHTDQWSPDHRCQQLQAVSYTSVFLLLQVLQLRRVREPSCFQVHPRAPAKTMPQLQIRKSSYWRLSFGCKRPGTNATKLTVAITLTQ